MCDEGAWTFEILSPLTDELASGHVCCVGRHDSTRWQNSHRQEEPGMKILEVEEVVAS